MGRAVPTAMGCSSRRRSGLGIASVMLLLAVSGWGGDGSAVADGSPTPTPPPANDMPPTSASVSGTYEVGGNALILQCEGTGSPTVVLEAGTGAPLGAMAELQRALAADNLVCAYQRARVDRPRTAEDVASDLLALLDEANVPGPYVLVGQSIGGEFAQFFARTFPDQAVGVVAMNSGPPCGPWLAALPALGNADLLAGETAYCAGDDGGSERFDGNASFQQEQSAPSPPDIPFELTISSVDADWCPPDQNQPGPFASQDQCHAAHDIHRRLAEEIVTQWPQGRFSEIDAPHEMYTTDLDTIVAIVHGVIRRTT